MHSLLDEDVLSRFAFDRGHIRADGTARNALLKPKIGQALSVFVTTHLTHFTICDHGHCYADNLGSGRVHFGYVTLSYKEVRAAGLQPNYDNTPPRHVSIPFNVDEPEKRLALAQVLALKASLLQECLF
jgi:hypothetical protein